MATKRVFTDQMNRQVEVSFPPKRIVSLVPSQTELLYDMGLADEVVGQTLFCIHPKEMHEIKPRVGGTKNFKLDKIKALNPDLIIGNKEENDKEKIEELAKYFPIWMSDIQTLGDALDMIGKVGELVGKEGEAKKIVDSIQVSFEELEAGNGGFSFAQSPILETKNKKLKVGYFIWRKPWMAAGNTTFIDDMLNRLGMENAFRNETSRYPEIDEHKLQSSNLDLILLSSEPYPFSEKHMEELTVLCPKAQILLVDGELFSWYGSRLVHSVRYFKELLERIKG
jgi:ABC-type Fe3+-hydroxamate transport system substrate-binding protein